MKFIDLLEKLSTWLGSFGGAVALLWILYGLFNWRILNRQGDGARQDYLKWLAGDNFRQFYLKRLENFLGWVAARIGDADHHQTPVSANAAWTTRWLGYNPWSWQSYDFSLKLALLYPLLFFIGMWVFGGNGQVMGMEVLPDVAVWRRLLLVIGLIIIFRFFRQGLRVTGQRSVLYLAIAFFTAISFWPCSL